MGVSSGYVAHIHECYHLQRAGTTVPLRVALIKDVIGRVQGSLVYTVAAQMKRALEKEMEPLLAEARGRTMSSDEKSRRSARVKEERKWHGE